MTNEQFTPEWVEQQRSEWRSEPLEADAIDCYRINYSIPDWYASGQFPPFGACLAIERLCCEIERLQQTPKPRKP